MVLAATATADTSGGLRRRLQGGGGNGGGGNGGGGNGGGSNGGGNGGGGGGGGTLFLLTNDRTALLRVLTYIFQQEVETIQPTPQPQVL